MNDPFVGQLTYFRVYSGKLEAGATVYNATKGKRERIGRLLRMHANKREDIKEVTCGNIAAAVGLRVTTTGDTLCDEKAPVVLELMDFPAPVIAIAIEPKTQANQEKLGQALAKLAMEDPSFSVKTDPETGQTLISGMGELHLEIIVDRLVREFKVEAYVGRPQVAYRETITREAESEGKYIRQTGGRGQYGHVVLRVGPMPSGKGVIFEDRTVGGAIPREFIPSVEKGVRESLARGVLAGYPMIDIQVTLTGGSFHEVDSSEMAFQIAGSMGAQAAARDAEPGAARAGDGGRGADPRRLHRRGDGQPGGAPRARLGHGGARLGSGDHGRGAAVDDVRLFDRRALDDPGAGHVHDAICALCTGSSAGDRDDAGANARSMIGHAPQIAGKE